MKAKFLILSFLMLIVELVNAQVAINTTGAVPHPSAVLDVSSDDKGLLIPRMTSAQMGAIASPTDGMIVFVTDSNSGMYQYRSGNWEKVMSHSGSLANGQVLFGHNNSIAQHLALFWNTTNQSLGVGTNTPSSTLSVTNTNLANSWITTDIGNATGSRVVMGNLSGNPTIGATAQALNFWDTLAINPGGPVSLPFYSGTSQKMLALKPSGVVASHTIGNGFKIENDSMQIGGSLTKNTTLSLNHKKFNLQGGTPESVITVNSNSSPSIFVISTDLGQSFVTQTNGTLNKISIIMGHEYNGFTGYYELYQGNGYNGAILATDNLFIPPFNANTYVDIPLNQAVTEGAVYTIRIHCVGNNIRHVVANDNIPGNLFHNFSNLTGIDLTLKVYETETLFDLFKVDGQTKTVNIEGSTSQLKIASLAGTGTRAVVVSSDGSISAAANAPATVTSVTGTAPIQVINTTTTPIISLPQATSTVPGYLAPGDYIAFNNKQNALPNASSIVSGILTNTDWNTFNNKQSSTSFATATASGVLSSTDWNTFNNKQSSTSFANATTSGVLSSTDWNTFNNKQNVLPNATTTTSGILTFTDWNTFNNKYNLPSLTSGSILFSNGSNIAQKNSHLFWDNTNNALGIGTNSPSAGLNIHGYGWNNGFRISQSSSGGVGPAVFLDGDRDFAIISTSTGAGAGAKKLNIYDASADQSRMVIDSSGAVGIGTNTPSSKLDINGAAGIKVSSNHNGSGYTDWVAGNFGGQGGNRVVIGVYDTIATIGAHSNALDQWRNIAINPNPTGNVGIGTTNPQYKLDVVGNQRVTGNLTTTGMVRQFVSQHAVTVPSASYPVVPFGGGPTTPSYGETIVIWVHNLGYNPILMTSLQMVNGSDVMHHVNVSYRHVDTDTVEFFFRNTSVSPASGTLNVIVVN